MKLKGPIYFCCKTPFLFLINNEYYVDENISFRDIMNNSNAESILTELQRVWIRILICNKQQCAYNPTYWIWKIFWFCDCDAHLSNKCITYVIMTISIIIFWIIIKKPYIYFATKYWYQ